MPTAEVAVPKLEVEGRPQVRTRVVADRLVWETPGALLAQQVAQLPAVRLVLERLAPDRYSVFVVLDQDDDATLDVIFKAEGRLYGHFRKMPFDVRVMKLSPEWDSTDLIRTAVIRYARP